MIRQQILVIEDSKAIGFLLQTILGKKYQVILAEDGYTAMHWLSQMKTPDLIIASPQLPDMQNWELIEYLISSGMYGAIPMIVLSATGKADTAGRCELLGLKDFFSKPFNPIDLEKCIEHRLYSDMENVMHMNSVHLKVG